MESRNNTIDPGQVERLEAVARYAMDALELCAAMGDYQTSLTKFKNRKDIFERSVQGLRQILPVAFYAFYAIDELSFDIELEHCDAPDKEEEIRETVDLLIEKGVVAQAFREKRTLTARSRDRRYPILIHALSTTSKSYGIFFCFLEKMPEGWGIVDKMTTIIAKSTCYALENFDLYQLIDQKNAALTEKNVQLSKSEIIYRNTFENTGNPTIIVDENGVITYSNSQFLAFSGFDREYLIGRKKISDFIAGNGRTGFSGILRKADNDDANQPTEYMFEDSRRRKRTVFLKISPLGIEDQYIISVNDVTVIKEAERQLQFQAFHDPLTGLPNRVLFQDRLKQAIKKMKRYSDYNFAVVFIDLDRFKTINDTLGHNVGDQLLVRTARRITDSVREVDTVARFGGDEFLILLEDVQDKNCCEVVTQRILERFQAPLDIEGHEIVVTLSMGVLIGGEQMLEQTDVVRLADMSMYEAKKQGRNRVVYTHEIADKEIEQRLQLENQLQKAIQKDEFFVEYQPLVELSSNRLYGVETLVRWNHPHLGIIPPNNFIPIAEETGFIIDLGRKIFELAFTDFADWRRRYPGAQDLYLNINLSVKQITKESLAEDIRRAAEAAGMPLSHVTLEITESVFIEDTERAIETINRLKSLGVSISIDDFGTGYASLHYLNQFAVDMVKIDKLLIQDIGSNPINFNIVSSMLDLCRKLGLKVLAEGIEDERQLAKLREMQCRLGQGYYFSKPRDKEFAEAFISGESLPVPTAT
jgi:diguanylate cyclase (GGDEF)-like protein/PAS domain S-box-containing protein